MATMVSGALITQFDRTLPEDCYFEDSGLEFYDMCGAWIIQDSEMYDVEKVGYIVDPTSDVSVRKDYADEITKWIKALSTVTFVVTVPREQEDSARSLLKNAGYGAV